MSWFPGFFRRGTAQQNNVVLQNNYGTITQINVIAGASSPIELCVPWNPVAAIENPSPSQLLTWHGRLTPLIGRAPELAALQCWVGAPANVSIWILAGEGGIGKTRLAAEFAESLTRKKWSAGFVDLARFNDAASLTLDKRTLLLVDYPEERPDQLDRLFDLLKRHTGPHKLRVALLTRSAPDVKKRLAERSATYLEYNEPWSFVAGSVPKYVLFRAAFAAACSNPPATLPDEKAFNAWLARSSLHTSALFVVAAALISRERGTGQLELVGCDVLAHIARDEMSKIKRAAGGDEKAANAAVDAVALATAFDGVTLATLRGLTNASELGFAATALRQTLLSTLHATEPATSACNVLRLEPDLYAAAFLNEWHLTRWNSDTHKSFDDAFAELWGLASVARVLPHWNRLAYDMTSRLGQSPNWLDNWLCDAAQNERVSAAAFTRTLSGGSWLGLPRAPSEIGKRVVASVGGDDEAGLVERSRLLNNVSVHMVQSGDRAGALDVAREAVTIRRRLAQANPTAYEPNLATSINNLANVLSETGDRAGALDAAREAETIYRRLAQAKPAAYEPDLAMSVHGLANRLSETGDRVGALDVAREAVTIRRRLAQVNPAAYEAELATSINNLAGCLGETGDRAGALDAARESVTILRRLAQAKPVAYEPDFAMSILNFANGLSAMGERAEALDAAREAATIYRRLAQSNPAAYEPNLATSVNNLANFLTITSDRAGALNAAREAVTIRGRLAQVNPAAYEPELAKSLCVLASALSAHGQKKLAGASATEAVTRLRPWAEQFPEQYGGLLAAVEELAAKLNAS